MRLFALIGAVCGVLSGAAMIWASVTDAAVPGAVWALIAAGWLVAVAAQICTYRFFYKKKK